MKKSLIAVGMVGLFGLTSVAVAAEFDWSGSIRAGYTSRDRTGEDTVRNLGGNAGSRINLNASTDLGNGQSAGTELSYKIDGDKIAVRRQNIWFSGDWGKLTLGKHGGIYRSAANWDQSSYLGGQVRLEAGDAGGDTAIVYSSNTPGPFSFDIEVASIAAIKPVTAVPGIYYNPDTNMAHFMEPVDGDLTIVPAVDTVGAVDGKAIGRWAATAHYDLGGMTVNLGYNAADYSENGYENNTVLSVNGTVGDFGYYVAYERAKHGGDGNENNDAAIIGIFLSYDTGPNRVYIESENASVDNASDPEALLVGYRRDLGAGVDFTTEYVTVRPIDVRSLNLTLRYGF